MTICIESKVEEEELKAYISELHLNNGEKIELNDDDIA